jgi:NADPH:quinone reductase-like Zn-dependent oxidoreductase
MSTMRGIQVSAFGDPKDVAKVVELPDPAPPGADDALIGVEFSPINPSDLLQIRGLYGVRPTLPSIVGGEGIGRVLAVGANVRNMSVGDRVLLPRGRYTWQELIVAPASDLFVTPAGDPQQLSMLAVNPPTAALMLKSYVDLAPGDWVIQNAGNSGVARAVAAFAREWGFRLISVVRRQELFDEVKAAGSEVVLLEGRDLASRAAEATGKAPIRLGLDAISGDSGFALSSALARDGTMVSYAALSAKPMAANPLNVIFRGLTITGFWLGHPKFQNSPAYLEALRDGAKLIASGKLHVPVAAAYSIDRAEQAIAHAQAGGKVLLDLGAGR